MNRRRPAATTILRNRPRNPLRSPRKSCLPIATTFWRMDSLAVIACRASARACAQDSSKSNHHLIPEQIINLHVRVAEYA